MGFSKIRMGQEEIIETIIKDSDGRQLERWVCMKRDYVKALRILNEKYGLNIEIVDKRKQVDDLAWAK